MARKSSREGILDAAEAVVLEKGAAHMSLDMVARQASVSKGGLMYHFPSKDDLLRAMVDRLLVQFYQVRDKKIKGLKESRGRWLKAEISAVLDPDKKRDSMALSILAAAAQSPHLLEPLRQAHCDHLKVLMSSGLPFERAAVVSLASDGLMFQELLRLTPFSPAQRSRIKKTMLQMVESLESGKEV
jgi:AcrR family transcriptional regulator